MATPEHFDWAAYTEAVAADIFGACNEEMSRAPDDVRFGNHGSVSVNYMTGQWYDFENERGGGIKELIRRLQADRRPRRGDRLRRAMPAEL